jgi:hypothetical protein
MDPIQYFWLNSGFLLAVLGLLTFLIGLLLGYFLFKKPNRQAELDAAQRDLNACIEKRRELERQLKAAQAQPTTPAVVTRTVTTGQVDYQPLRERQRSYYAHYVTLGNIRHDNEYGFVYTRRPDVVDDLKEIKGVGEALALKLNEAGVYTFRQIAIWDEDMAGRFAERLDAFKDRVIRDQWIEQAAELHFQKYGERL